jgi:hypothetical protein
VSETGVVVATAAHEALLPEEGRVKQTAPTQAEPMLQLPEKPVIKHAESPYVTPVIPEEEVPKVVPNHLVFAPTQEVSEKDVDDVDEASLYKELNHAEQQLEEALEIDAKATVYRIQMGTFSELRYAKELVHKIEQAGYHANNEVMIAADGRPVSKVMVTVAGSEMEAKRVQSTLAHDLHIKGIIVHE